MKIDLIFQRLQCSFRLLMGFRSIAGLSLTFLLSAGPQLRADSGTWDPQGNSEDWNTAANWSSNTVPNGVGQVASFAGGDGNIFISAPITIDTITASSGPYIIASQSTQLTLTGAGISSNRLIDLEAGSLSGTNGSIIFTESASLGKDSITDNPGGGSTTFEDSSDAGTGGGVNNYPGTVPGQAGGLSTFEGNSSAGSATIYNDGGYDGGQGGLTIFMNSATAASANIQSAGGTDGGVGEALFRDNATAGTANFSNSGGETVFTGSATADRSTTELGAALISGGAVGQAHFYTNSTAANSTFHVDGGSSSGEAGGVLDFHDSSTAGSAMITVSGSSATAGGGAYVTFYDSASAGSSSITVNGGSASSADAGTLSFGQNSSAGSATLIANGGTNGGAGGEIDLMDDSTGGSADVEVNGNATFAVDEHDAGTVTIASLQGSGNVHLGSNTLNIDQNTTREVFSGAISDGRLGGSLTKTGSGNLVLDGASSYTGPTTVAEGTLEVNGSLTSDVTVNRGATLTGLGSVGDLTLQSGGVISPGSSSNSPPISTLTAQSLLWERGGTLNFNVFGPISYLNLSGALDTDSAGNGPLVFDFHHVGIPRVGQTINLIGFTSEAIPLADFVSQPGDGIQGVFSYNNDQLQFTFEAVPEPPIWVMLLASVVVLMGAKRTVRARFYQIIHSEFRMSNKHFLLGGLPLGKQDRHRGNEAPFDDPLRQPVTHGTAASHRTASRTMAARPGLTLLNTAPSAALPRARW